MTPTTEMQSIARTQTTKSFGRIGNVCLQPNVEEINQLNHAEDEIRGQVEVAGGQPGNTNGKG